MPISLLYEWMAFYMLEPFGWREDEYHSALIASVIANTARNPKKRRRPFEPTNFMRREQKIKTKNTTQKDFTQKIKTIFGAMGNKK